MMKAICIKEAEGLTVGKEYNVINAFGIKNDFKLEIENDLGLYEEYRRMYFSNLY